ncbi:MAG: MFS transporter [Pseudomonadales bacterium]|nr:MFS transporter [Pseudomonadales bacterium]
MQYSDLADKAEPQSFFQVNPDGHVTRLLLALLATSGLFYVNIMPAIVEGLIVGLDLSNKQAGIISSSNVYGAAFGAFAAIFIVAKIPWRMSCVVLLLAMMLADSLSIFLTDFSSLIAVRFVHGTVGGMIVGIAFSLMAKTKNVERSFGYLLTVQFGLGGLGLIYIPPLLPEYGTTALFATLIAFNIVNILLLPLIPELHAGNASQQQSQGVKFLSRRYKYLLLAALLATFMFQAANMGIFAYIISIGKQAALDITFISNTLGQAAWISLLGSVLVILIAHRMNRRWPLLLSILITIAATLMLHASDSALMYWLANSIVGITWAFAISYLLGMCSSFDDSGQAAALAGFFSKMGLASGPMVCAYLSEADDFSSMINLAAVILLVAAMLAHLPAAALDKQTAPDTAKA